MLKQLFILLLFVGASTVKAQGYGYVASDHKLNTEISITSFGETSPFGVAIGLRFPEERLGDLSARLGGAYWLLDPVWLTVGGDIGTFISPAPFVETRGLLYLGGRYFLAAQVGAVFGKYDTKLTYSIGLQFHFGRPTSKPKHSL